MPCWGLFPTSTFDELQIKRALLVDINLQLVKLKNIGMVFRFFTLFHTEDCNSYTETPLPDPFVYERARVVASRDRTVAVMPEPSLLASENLLVKTQPAEPFVYKIAFVAKSQPEVGISNLVPVEFVDKL